MKRRATIFALGTAIAFSLACAPALANTVTVTYPQNGHVYSGPSGNNPFTANWAWTTDGFGEDVNVTLAYPECDVDNWDGGGVGIGWNCEQLGDPPTGLPADGSHTFTVKRYATSGSPLIVVGSSTFTVDTQPPVVSASLTVPPVNGFVPLKRPAISFSATDLSLNTASCALDGGAAFDCKGQTSFTPPSDLAEGAHQFTIAATDVVANTGPSASATLNFTIDTVPPVIALTAPSQGQLIENSLPGLQLSISGGTAQCNYDNGAYVPCDAAFVARTLPDGPHSLSVLASDLAGNSSSAFVLFSIDTGLALPQAPRSALFTNGKVRRAKSGGIVRTIIASIVPPANATAQQACVGIATISASARVGKRTKTFKKRVLLSAAGAYCRASASFRLPAALTGRKLKLGVSGAGGPRLAAFEFSGKLKN